MAFKLPKYSDLTNEQRIIVNLPLDKNHLVTGAPGTGKSVIAIYSALSSGNIKCVLGIFNAFFT